MKDGWEIKKLGEVIQKTETIDPTKRPDIEFRYVDLSSVNNQDFFVESTTTLKGKDAPSRARKLIRTHDVIFATVRPTLKRVAIIEDDLDEQVCSTGYFVLRAKETIHYKLLFYYLLTDGFIDKMQNLQKGASYPAVTDSDVKDQTICYPKSLPEQQRIVSILEEAFAAIARAKANAEQNLRNAKELFESYLQGVFERKGEGWEEKRLAEVAKHSLGKMLDKNKNKGILQKYLRNQSVRWFEFDLSDLTEMPFLETEREKYAAVKGDVLICEGGYPGRAAIWQEDYPIYFQKAIHRVRFNNPVYNKLFLYHLYLSDKTGKLKEHFSGTGIQHFTGEALAKYLIPLPPPNKTETIVQQLDALSAETKKLETIYQQKINDLEEMKKSILQKAFSGEL